jgi:predicted phosphodiesterase
MWRTVIGVNGGADLEVRTRRRADRQRRLMAAAPAQVAEELAAVAAVSQDDPMAGWADRPVRVLVAGDTHGQFGWLKFLFRVASKQSADGVVVVGDFGFWSHTAEGRTFLNSADRLAVRSKMQLLFIDGNHENHDLLNRVPVAPSGVRRLRSQVTHLPRGWAGVWSGVRVGAFGGAVSSDRVDPVPGRGWDRVAGFDWWPQEAPSAEDFAVAVAAGPLDVLLSHDAPAGVSVPHRVAAAVDVEVRSAQVRDRIAALVRASGAQLVVHGHHHVRYSDTLSWVDAVESERSGAVVWGACSVEGLAADGSMGSGFVQLDCDKGVWSVTDGPAVLAAASRTSPRSSSAV